LLITVETHNSLIAAVPRHLICHLLQSVQFRVLLVLDENQYGCRPGRSTTHALIAIQHKWLQTLDSKGSVRVLFVDFRKAFDIVNHNVLFTKLKNFNVSHCLLKWFGLYVFHQCQRVGNCISSWKIHRGSVPRGSKLGPLSSIVMIDDQTVKYTYLPPPKR